jgi:hypothetical protein
VIIHQLRDETTEEFRLLVAEIANEERVSWPEALRRARQVWPELSSADPEEPIPYRRRIDWRFVVWCLLLLLVVSLSANIGFAWVLLGV